MLLFDCGCIAFAITRPDPAGKEGEEHLLLYACDSRDEPALGVYWRKMHGKAHTELDRARAEELLTELGQLAADGQRYRELRALLRIP